MDSHSFRKTAPSFTQSPRSPITSKRSTLLQNDIKNIMEKASHRVKVTQDIYSNFDKLDGERGKLSNGISAFIESEREANEFSERSLITGNKLKPFENDQLITNILDYVKEQEFEDQLNKVNFQSKQDIRKVAIDNFTNSVFVAKMGRPTIWKPNKSLSGRKSMMTLS